jgi:hypothetical protein
MTQTERILQHLRAGNSLTPLEELNYFGCLRLAARILNAKLSGPNGPQERQR